MVPIKIKILCVELIEATFRHQISKYASRKTLETLLSSLLNKTSLQNLVGRGLYLSKKRISSLVNDENC